MSELTEELARVSDGPQSETVEYKAVLIPARNIAQIMSAFANGRGGCLIFGIARVPGGRSEIRGLSGDFDVIGMIHKAMDLLMPRPTIEYTYFDKSGMQLFGLKVYASEVRVTAEGKEYKREDAKTILAHAEPIDFTGSRYLHLTTIAQQFIGNQSGSTSAKYKFLDHYLNVLKLYDRSKEEIFPAGVSIPTTIPSGKMLNRILFSSCIDNFETYLSDLLYEIYLAKPDTLRGGDATVKVSDVLDCADREEFIKFYAGRKIRKLQKGSVKGFVAENREVAQLEVISKSDIDKMERILQIRHLYTHRNGMVDESFLAYYPGALTLNCEHVMSIEEVIGHLVYLAGVVNQLDAAAIAKYLLSTV